MMKFQVLAILLVGCRLAKTESSDRAYRRNAPAEERWINIDEELAGSHPDFEPPPQFSLDLHMEFPQNPDGGEKMMPMVKNPMWIDKLAIIKAPPMYPSIQEDYEPIPINYRSSIDRDMYQISKSRQRRSTQQNKKITRQSEKKSKFKAWLESKKDKKIGEKLSETLSKFKPVFSRQTRSVDNDVTETMEVKEEKDNRINRASGCQICGGFPQSCPYCLLGSIHPPRPQFIEFINGEPSTYIPGAHHTTLVGVSPRYVFDQLGHRYLERDGSLQILPPSMENPIVSMPPSNEYKILYDTIQRYPHFQIAHRLEDGQLTDNPIKQTQDFIEFIRNLAQSKNQVKNHQKRHAQKDTEEAIVDEEALMELLLEQDREFEKYLEQIGYSGKVEMFDMEMENDDHNPTNSQSIFLDIPKSTSNNFHTSSAKQTSSALKKVSAEPQRSHSRFHRPQE